MTTTHTQYGGTATFSANNEIESFRHWPCVRYHSRDTDRLGDSDTHIRTRRHYQRKQNCPETTTVLSLRVMPVEIRCTASVVIIRSILYGKRELAVRKERGHSEKKPRLETA